MIHIKLVEFGLIAVTVCSTLEVEKMKALILVSHLLHRFYLPDRFGCVDLKLHAKISFFPKFQEIEEMDKPQ